MEDDDVLAGVLPDVLEVGEAVAAALPVPEVEEEGAEEEGEDDLEPGPVLEEDEGEEALDGAEVLLQAAHESHDGARS